MITVHLIAALFLFFALWWLLLATAALFHRPPRRFTEPKSGETIVLVPAYRPGPAFEQVLASLQEAVRPLPATRVFVLLQEAGPGWDRTVRRFGFMTASASFAGRDGNPYHHALRYAVNAIRSWGAFAGFEPARLLLLDKDNRIDARSVEILHDAMGPGTGYVQGRRIPLETATPAAAADALSERLNDQLFRRGLAVLTGTPELSGSGILFSFSVFEEAVARLDGRAPGMDKALMSVLIRSGVRGVYEPRAVVREEKTDTLSAIRSQRTRWLGMQYYIAWFHGFRLMAATLRTGRPAGLVYALTLLRPPRSAHLAIAGLAGGAEFVWLLAGQAPVLGFAYGIAAAAAIGAAVVPLLFEAGAPGLIQRTARILPRFAAGNLAAAAAGLHRSRRGTFIHTVHKAA